MGRKEVILQIFTGGYQHKETDFEQIKSKLLPLLETLEIQAVIAGWAIDRELYRQLADLLHSYSVKLFLWLPVFSENGALKESKKIVDYHQREIQSFSYQEGENFEFYCPNNRNNQENVIAIYEEYFSEIEFDGVFLDKIRYAAFSNNRDGVFSCFCIECQKKYEEYGISIPKLLEEMRKVEEQEGIYSKEVLGIEGYQKGKFAFDAKIWEEFFELKGELVAEALLPIVNYLKQKKKEVGFDTFSPCTAYFAGQNMEKLSQMADFIKPMMYRITNAPAGMPFEIDRLIAETTTKEEARKNLFAKIGCKDTGKEAFSIEFVKKEVEIMLQYGKPIYCGIEINRICGIAEVTPSYIKETITALNDLEIKGFVLSWNLLSAPEENIEQIIKSFR